MIYLKSILKSKTILSDIFHYHSILVPMLILGADLSGLKLIQHENQSILADSDGLTSTLNFDGTLNEIN